MKAAPVEQMRRFLSGLRADEIIVDCFAGGGGASEAIRLVFGRDPDIAINHDAEAICMHRANHPGSRHYQEGVWQVDPVAACAGRRVGLMWLSPDCTDFSKAKGGKPISKKRRALAFVAVRWARAVRPRVIVLENVEEFEGWGPLIKDARGRLVRDPLRVGRSFKIFVGRLRGLGYQVEWSQGRACDFGAPTTRRRLFLIARCDRNPIEWAQPTHGEGRAEPYRTAAECIDWDLPCPSIFMTAEEAKAFYRATGIRIKRPLEEPTMRRIGRGTFRFVIDHPDPFIVPVTHAGDQRVHSIHDPLPTQTGAHRGEHAIVSPHIVPMQHENSPESVDEPLSTVTSQGNKHVLVAPFVTKWREGSAGSSMNQPMPTVTGHSSETHPGGAAPLGVVMPYLAGVGGRQGQSPERAVDEPMHTATAKEDTVLVAPSLIQMGYGEDKKRNQGRGQPPRALDIQQPIGTIVEGRKHALVTSFLQKYYGDTGQRPGSDMREPTDAITAIDHHAVVAAHLQRDFGKSVGDDVRNPAPTITPGGGGKTALVASHLLKLHGSSVQGDDLRSVVPTIRAGGNHLAEVRAFLIAYYRTEQSMGHPRRPLPTITPEDRFAIVTVHGQEYVIVDIGMRMLTPRERFRAQGFRDSYVIDPLFEYRYRYKKGKRKGQVYRVVTKPLTQEAQGRMCGNSVSPPHAAAILRTLFQMPARQEAVA